MKILLASCAALILVCVAWRCTTPRGGAAGATAGSRPPPAVDAGPTLDRVLARGGRAPAGALPEAQAGELVLATDDLLERLRRTGRAWNEHDAAALESNLESLLHAPATPRRVLALVREGRLGAQSLEEQGAVLVIAFGAASETRRAELVLDGRPFTRDVLETLALLEAEPAEPIATFTASLVVEGKPAVGARWLGCIARLRDEVPEHAANFDPLLHAIFASGQAVPPDAESAALLAAILMRATDPLTVEAALAVLLATDAAGFLPLAEELHARSRSSPAIAAAILDAIARHAPVELAAQSLVRLASGSPYGAFRRLCERPGARTALEREYSALVAANANPNGRKMLVSALAAEPATVLLGIAETDPDASVRHQALLTLTLAPTDAPEVMATLRARHAARRDPRSGLSTRSGLSIAENLTLHGSPRVRADAVAWLKQVVTDPTESLEDRRLAWAKLQARARPDELAGLQPP
jgi:hypothetical protein